MQNQKQRPTNGRSGGYYWDKSTLDQRRRARLQRLESENHTSIPEFDKQVVASSVTKKRLGRPPRSSSLSPSSDSTNQSKRMNRKETRQLVLQKQSLADLLTLEMQEMGEQGKELELYSCIAKGNLPERHFCSICGYWGIYTCVDCGMRYCSLICKGTHADTRCLKHVA